LNLSDNQLSGIIPEEICNTVIPSVGNNNLCPPYPDCISQVDQDSQDISECVDACGVLGGDGSSCILWGETAFDIATTTEIYCSNFDTEGQEIPYSIGDLDNLERIDCSNAGLVGSIPWSLNSNLSNLTYINLDQNSLSGNITSHPLLTVPNLETLYLSQNNLTGSIANIRWMVNIETFMVSSNQLSGSIPPTIGDLQYLREFRVNDNQLTGNIPAEFGNLTTLNDGIFLHDNLFYGVIPEDVCGVMDFQNINLDPYFWISNNQFCPPYPSCIDMTSVFNNDQDTSNCDGAIGNVCGYNDFEYLSGCGSIMEGCSAYGVEGLAVIADGYCELVGYTSAVSYDVITTGPVQNVLNIGCNPNEANPSNYSCVNVGYCNENNPGSWGVSDSWPVLTNLVCE